jgi:hypothetical protein
MEFTQDRLRSEIRRLEAELEAHKSVDRERVWTEAALFLIGLLIGTFLGYHWGVW